MADHAGRAQAETASGAFLESERLTRLRTAQEPAVAAQAWLETIAELISGLKQAVIVLNLPAGPGFAPVAAWPAESTPSRALMTATDGAVRAGRLVLETIPPRAGEKSGDVAIAYPVLISGRVRGAAAVEIAQDADRDLRLAIDQLAWGCGWLETIIRRRTVVPADRLATAVEVLATSLHHRSFQDAATAVATELAGMLGCERVSIGFMKGRHVRIRALSNSASFGKKANLVRAVEAAMAEAVDQQAPILFPLPSEARPLVVRAHGELFNAHGTGPICTVPLAEGRNILGAMTLEKPEGESFDAATVQLCEHVAALLGPILEVKRREDRLLATKAWDSFVAKLRHLIGPRHTGLKLASAAALLAAAFLIFAKGEYRVGADANVEGIIQRSVAVPIAGYLAEANARAGDVVREGQLLALLDDRDLRLEKLKWVSQRAKQEREYSDALSKHERAKAQILRTQMDQATAQIELIEEQLRRLRITAPFDGYVVSGDLSQSLGAPVERGNVLFEIAPLNKYRVILKVDERDVADVREGQTGTLVLSAEPDVAHTIRVAKVTPISAAEEGRNYFRIEASIEGGVPAGLRPGMKGVGKIAIEDRRYAWIWTHRVAHWAKLLVWSWWP